MLKYFTTLGAVLLCSTVVLASPLWHCIASNAKSAVWNQYGQTRESASSAIAAVCSQHNNHKLCEMVCFPPKIYWRCLAHDTVPIVKAAPGVVAPQQGTWYWTSFSKQIAINGARDACRHNSQYGGCYVDPKACAST
jgi:hypothetical protein